MKNDQLIKVRFKQKDAERLRAYKADTGVKMNYFILMTVLKELKKLGY